MSEYHFSSLNDKEFESLCVDILSANYKVRIERFKAGRDGGVDGRFFTTEGEEVVIQCKHWEKSGLTKLMSSLKNSEVQKVDKLNPTKYIFATSIELSRADKQKLKQIFNPYIESDNDIWGNEDLQDALSKTSNQWIIDKHYKLWITSTNVVKRIINSAIKGRSQYKLDEIAGHSSRYVVTDSHQKAVKVLEQLKTVIIKGAPGVGKTTLADQLCQQYVADGFELVFIENSLNEAEQVYEIDKRQLFYFDDFLGRNYLQAINNHEDSHIVNFIKRITKDATKRFILTTRSNILNQGWQLSDLFNINKLDRNEFEVSVSNLSNLDKAKILYNHIWFGNLNNLYIDEIYENQRYVEIINHLNFNPRLISFITDSERLEDIEPTEYWSHVESLLNNPEDVWAKVLQQDIDSISRHLIVGMVLHGGAIRESVLESFFLDIKNSDLEVFNKNTFYQVIRLLTGALINRTISKDEEVSYDLFNPSIGDYVIKNYFSDANYLNSILTSLKSIDALGNIKGLLNSESVNNKVLEELVSKQLTQLSNHQINFPLDTYQKRLFLLCKDMEIIDEGKRTFFERVANSLLREDSGKIDVDLLEVANLFLSLDIINPQSVQFKLKLEQWLDKAWGLDQHKPISTMIARVEGLGGQLTNNFKNTVREELCESITDDIIDNGILDDMYSEDYSVGMKVDHFIEKTVADLDIKLDDSDLLTIADCCEYDEIIQHNIDVDSGHYEPDWDKERFMDRGNNLSISEADAIEDLFDRSN